MKRSVWGAAAVTMLACACSAKTVVNNSPTWQIVSNSAVTATRLDLVLAIDNSSSMADKQALLAASIPYMLGRLTEQGVFSDVHVAIVSSSLGGGGSPDVCVSDSTDSTHQNDAGHLINRTASGPIANGAPLDGTGGNFLAWLPSGTAASNVTAYKDITSFETDIQSLVIGTGETGCGLEAQLESWYRFLIQPDPYSQFVFSQDVPPKATPVGVDSTVLKMRHDFLRPDSVVLIVQITDEEDSWSDPLWFGGFGWTARTQNFPNGPNDSSGVGPRGTSECDVPVDVNNPTTTGPNDPNCVSCAFAVGSNSKPNGDLISNDPNCEACAPGATTCTKKGWYSAATPTTPITAADGLNVRYGNQYMRQRYGFDNQFSIQRYIDGLSRPMVADRDHEVHDSTMYTSQSANCVNPLFAENLPDGTDTSNATLCKLEPGQRLPEQVIYALIGGLPPELIKDQNNNRKSPLSTADWTAILGKDPGHYIFDGIDPHMIESTPPRAGLPTPTLAYSLGSDPENGREWNTLTSAAGIDLQYACTFTLSSPRDCTATTDPSCECTASLATSTDSAPLCDPQIRTNQVRAKAYPTIRELRVAKGMGVQGVVGSVCDVDPTRGYQPTTDVIVDAAKSKLGCLSSVLLDTDCELVVAFPGATNQAAGCTDGGIAQPSQSLLTAFAQEYPQLNPSEPTSTVACVANEVSCTGSDPGWCLTSTSTCTNAVGFSPSWVQPPGSQLLLMCPITAGPQ